MTRARDVADTQDNVGGAVSPFVAGKNRIINGDFFWNQRNFTSNTAGATYNFDRWAQNNGGSTGTLTVTPQVFSPGTAPVVGYEARNFVQLVTASGASTNTYAILYQRTEDARTFAGQAVTVSFWAKSASGTPKVGVEIEQYFGTGGSPSANTFNAGGSVTISTTWTRYSVTLTLPSVSGKTFGTDNNSWIGLNLWVSSGTDFATRSSSIGLQNSTFHFWGVQLEAGSVATPFTTATGNPALELAACQRYYQRFTSGSTGVLPNYSRLGAGSVISISGKSHIVVPLRTFMRSGPTSLDFGGTLNIYDGAGETAVTALSIDSSNTHTVILAVTTVDLTDYRPVYLTVGNDSNAYIGFSSEL